MRTELTGARRLQAAPYPRGYLELSAHPIVPAVDFMRHTVDDIALIIRLAAKPNNYRAASHRQPSSAGQFVEWPQPHVRRQQRRPDRSRDGRRALGVAMDAERLRA